MTGNLSEATRAREISRMQIDSEASEGGETEDGWTFEVMAGRRLALREPTGHTIYVVPNMDAERMSVAPVAGSRDQVEAIKTTGHSVVSYLAALAEARAIAGFEIEVRRLKALATLRDMLCRPEIGVWANQQVIAMAAYEFLGEVPLRDAGNATMRAVWGLTPTSPVSIGRFADGLMRIVGTGDPGRLDGRDLEPHMQRLLR